MRKFAFVFIAATSLISCSEEKSIPADADILQQNLKGKVQTFEESSFPVDSTGIAGKQDSLFTLNEFNESGYQTKSITKFLDGKVKSEDVVDRYENGMFKSMTRTADGKEIFKLTTELDDKKAGYKSAKTFDSTGKQDSYYTDIKMNEGGVVYAAKQFKMDGSPKLTFEYVFDKYTYKNGKATDSAGRVTYEGWLKSNDKGDPIEEYSKTLDKDSTKEETFQYKYDSYDEKGNWTQRTTSKDGKATKITKRKFTYYKD